MDDDGYRKFADVFDQMAKIAKAAVALFAFKLLLQSAHSISWGWY